MKSLIYWSIAAAAFIFSAGCDNDTQAPQGERTIAEDTDVDEGLFGGTTIEKKQVIEKENGQREIREKETHLDDEGNVTKQETETKSTDGDTKVDVDADEHGIDVDVKSNE